MTDRLKVQCPCCQTRLVIDSTTGDILSEERPKPSEKVDFAKAVNEVESGSEKREKLFEKAFDRTRRLDDILEKKFEEAREKAKKDDSEKPMSPLDLD